MITELDEVKCQNTFAMIDASSLEAKTKSDLKEAIEESKLNLNGRTLEERVQGIARNQFDTTRFLAEIIIQFKNVAEDVKKNMKPKRSWKDTLVETQWALVTLGSVIAICSIFAPEIISLLKAVVTLIH